MMRPKMLNERDKADETRSHRRCELLLFVVELIESDLGNSEERAAECLLQHRRGCADDADPRRHVETQHQPQAPELWRLVRVLQVHALGRDHGVVVGRRGPALRAPARGRQAVAKGADQHEQEIDRRHREECLPHARIGRCLEGVHEQGREWRTDHRTAAEAHYGHAGGHAAPIREPLDERRDRRDIAEPQTDAADDPRAEPHQPQLVRVYAHRRDQETTAPAKRGHHARLARTSAFKPPTPGRCRKTQQHKEERVHPAEIELTPVAIGSDKRVQRSCQLFGKRRCSGGAGRDARPVGADQSRPAAASRTPRTRRPCRCTGECRAQRGEPASG